MNNLNYVILSEDDVGDIDFSQVFQKGPDSLRYSLDGSQTFVKFSGDTPDFLEGKTLLNQSEILNELSGEDWTSKEPFQ